MTEYIRRLVSGNKARFKDQKLNVELDLVYVTDQVIIMGFPASGVEGLYRNRREDAVRFLESRHSKNYWVFNLCPIKENSYDAGVFEGRVSRYPFPDHHAPPLAVMPLVAREIHAWLSGSPERVAVLHCKAGKGRSGTMACTYLLSVGNNPLPPQLERSHNAKTWAQQRMRQAVEAIPEPDPQEAPKPVSLEKVSPSDMEGILDGDRGGSPLPETTPNPEKSFTDALKGVLDLHTAQRMKAPAEDGKVKQGVSIPSQRRFLWYWALLLAHEAPAHLWAQPPAARPKVRLTQLTLRMREQSTLRLSIVKAANKLIERTSLAKGPHVGVDPKGSSSQVWASLARYDDRLVDLLENWEAYTRHSNGDMGQRRPGSERMAHGESKEIEVLHNIFDSGKWDKGKMVRSFARLGAVDNKQMVADEEGYDIDIHTLNPLSDKRWEGLRHDIKKEQAEQKVEQQEILQEITQKTDEIRMSPSDAESINEIVAPTTSKNTPRAPGVNPEQGIILDAGREVRIKLYIGQVFIGWLWFIPTFHMPQPPPSADSRTGPSAATTLKLSRKDLDFPLGLGSAIIDVTLDMEWVVPPPGVLAGSAQTPLEPPVCHRTGESDVGAEAEPAPTGPTTAVLQALAGGGAGGEGVGLREAVEARQGAND